MIFSIVIVSISILLEAFLSNYIPIFVGNHNLFIPMFTIVSLVIVFPYFNENSKFLKLCFIFGIIYDILFTNTIGLNISLFLLIGLIVIFLDNGLSNTLFSILIKMIVSIIIYDVLSYGILLLLNYMHYDFLTLFMKIVKSFILNITYTVILYFVVEWIAKKLYIKKLN